MSPFSPALRRLKPALSDQVVHLPSRVSFTIALFFASLIFTDAAAQSCSTANAQPSLSAWNTPLDRTVSLHARDISLRDALDRVSSDARIQLSYASEKIPVDTRVCAQFDSIPLGEALGLLLRGTTVLPVSGGGEHVVLMPSPTPGGDQPVPRMLDRVVVTGNTIEAPERSLTVATNVVSGTQLSRYPEEILVRP